MEWWVVSDVNKRWGWGESRNIKYIFYSHEKIFQIYKYKYILQKNIFISQKT